MSGRRLQYTIGVNADISKAKSQLADLQKQLTSLTNSPSILKSASSLGVTKEIQQASLAASTLQTHLTKAMNVNTGKLDLSKLQANLKQSGYSLKDYKKALMTLGPEGQKAFSQVTRSIVSAEVPLRQTSKLVDELGRSLKNTLKFHISNTVINSLAQSLGKAYRYAEDLNESLTRIRVVTGKSSTEMAKFAKQANEAAKALNTTTTAYTEASLIFFQQGLDSKAVEEKTATVIKLANVTGQTASQVSSYMTAIWNNFDDGSQSLEHYADVITKLGATTASSSSEIAAGLEKFASVANTVGLSYDYATSAIATTVAQTRQSADTIGTAFKTIFSRLQDLEQGETADDGTTLGQYSLALEKIGVNIKTASGGIKDMDDILDEAGAKWSSLSKDMQIATAEAVAGTRQYGQFIALMDNWDTFKINLQTTQSADGTLDEQANIFSESWEAARKRVITSLQGIYDNLIDDKFFIALNDGLSATLDILNKIITATGGLKGVLLSLSAILTRIFTTQIAQGLRNTQYNVLSFFGKNDKVKDLRKQALEAEQERILQPNTNITNADRNRNTLMKSNVDVGNNYVDVSNRLNETQKTIVQPLYERQIAANQAAIAASDEVDERRKETDTSRQKLQRRLQDNGISNEQQRNYFSAIDARNQAEKVGRLAENYGVAGSFNEMDTNVAASNIETVSNKMNAIRSTFDSDEALAEEFGEEGSKAFKQFSDSVNESIEKITTLREELSKLEGQENPSQNAIQEVTDKIDEEIEKVQESYEAFQDSAEQQRTTASENLENEKDKLKDSGVVRKLEAEEEARTKRQNIADNRSAVVEEAKIDYETVKEEIENDFENSVKDLLNEKNTQIAEIENNKQQIIDNALNNEDTQNKINSAEQKKDKRIDKFKDKYNQFKSGEIDASEVSSKFASNLEKNKAKYGDNDTAVKKTAEQELKRLKEQGAREIKKIKEEAIKSVGGKELKEIEASAKKSMEEVEKKYEQEVAKMENKKNTALGSAEADRDLKIAQAEGNYASKAEDIEEERQSVLENLANSYSQLEEAEESYNSATLDTAVAEEELTEQTSEVINSAEQLGDALDRAEKQPGDAAQGFVQLSSALSAFAFVATNAISIGKQLADGSLDLGTAISQIGMSALTLIPVLTSLNAANIAACESAIFGKISFLGLNTILADTAAGAAVTASSIAALALPIIAVVAVIAAVVIGLKAFKEHLDLANGTTAFKELSASAEQLKDKVSEAKSAVEELSTAFNNYDTAIDTLKSCVQGTDEWYNALKKVNDEVNTSLETYPELFKYTTVNDNGQMEISQEGRDLITEETNKKAGAYDAASAIVDSTLKTIKVDKKIKDAQDERQVVTMEQNNYLGLKETGTLDEESIKLQEETFDLEFKKIDNKIKKLEEEKESYKASTQLKYQSAASDIISNEDIIGNTEMVADVKKVAANVLKQASEEAYSQYENISRTANYKQEDVKKVFSDWADKNFDKDDVVKLVGGNAKEGFEYSVNGTKQTEKIQLDTMTSFLAGLEATEQLTQNIEEINQKLLDLANSSNAASHAMEDFAAKGNLGKTTEEEFDDLKNELSNKAVQTNKNGKIEDTDENKKAINDYLKETYGDNYLDILGVNDTEEAAKKFTEEFNNRLKAWETALNSSGEKTANRIKDLDTSELGPESLTTLASYIERAFTYGGEEGVSKFKEIYKAAAKDGKAEEFVNTLNAFDWNTKGPESLQEALNNAGVTTQFTVSQLQELIDKMRNVGSGVKGLTAIFGDTISAIANIEDGATISSDTYEKLKENYKQYFHEQLDGSYKLIESASKVKRELIEDEAKTIAQQQKNTEEKVTNVEKIGSSYDMNKLSTTAQPHDREKIQQQIAVALTFGSDEDTQLLTQWKENIDSLTNDELEQLKTKVNECSESVKNYEGTIKELQTEQYSAELSFLEQFNTFDDLKEAYENSTVSLNAFNVALTELDKQLDLQNLDTEELKEYADYLQEIGAYSDELYDNMSDDDAEKVAKGILKMNKAIDTLNEKFVISSENGNYWLDILRKSDKTSQEFAEAIIGTKKAVADLLDISSEYVSADFVMKHLDDINNAATGSETAIDGLKKALSEDVIASIKLQVEDEGVKNEIDDIASELGSKNIEVGMSITAENDEAFIEACNKMIADAGMTADQVQAYFDSIGFEPTISTTQVQTPGAIAKTETWQVVDYTKPNPVTGESGERHTTEYVQTESIPTEGYVTVPAMAGDGGIPKVTALTAKASGSFNNYSSKNPGGAKSGSSGSKSNKDKKKNESDPYEKIERTIDRLTKKLDELGKEQSHVFGDALIENLKEENELLEKQIKNYNELDKVINQQTAKNGGQLKWYGIKFDENGEMTNYNEIYQKELDRYNGAVSTYNSSAKNDADEKLLDNAENRLEVLKDLHDAYNEALDKSLDNSANRLDAVYKEIENNFKAWETKFTVKIELADAKKNWKDFMKEINSDFKSTTKNYSAELEYASESYAAYEKEQFQTAVDKVQETKAEIEKLEKTGESDIFASVSEGAKQLQTDIADLEEKGKNLFEELTKAWETYLESIDDVIEKWGEVQEKFESINTSISNYTKIIDLLNGDSTKGQESKLELLKVQSKNDIANIKFWRAEKESLEKERQELIDSGEKVDSEAVKKLDDQIDAANKALESSVVTQIENALALRNAEITLAYKTLEDGLTNNLGFDAVNEEWEYANWLSDRYYDNIEKIYNIESLESKWQSAISKASTLKSQQKLTALMDEQVKSLKNKTKLSKYDVELAEKRLAVAEAEIALEEAKNNKDTMKLVRDGSGNWSYQYVADEDAINEAQQKVNDAQSNVYEYTKQEEQQATKDYITFLQQYMKASETIANASYSNEADRKAAQEKLYNMYYGENGYITNIQKDHKNIIEDLNEETFKSIWQLYKDGVLNYEDMTDDQKALVDGFKDGTISSNEEISIAIADYNSKNLDSWKTTAKEMSDAYNADEGESVKNSVKTALGACESAQTSFDTAVKNGTEAAGIDYTNLNVLITKLKTEISNTEAETEKLREETGHISDNKAKVDELQSSFEKVKSVIESINSNLSITLDKINEVDGKNVKITKTIETKHIDTGSATTPVDLSGSGGSGDGGSGGDGKYPGIDTAPNNIATVTKKYRLRLYDNDEKQFISSYQGIEVGNTTYEDTSDAKKVAKEKASEIYKIINNKPTPQESKNSELKKVTFVIADDSTGQYSKIYDKEGNSLDGIYDYRKYVKFDTGGYTGKWNDGSGKLAMLHEKEIVLNKYDTENILDAVSMIRDLNNIQSAFSEFVNKNIDSMYNKLVSAFEKSSNLNGISNNKIEDNTTNNYTINAEFPNANDVNEIREALLSLPNLAAQYVSSYDKS